MENNMQQDIEEYTEIGIELIFSYTECEESSKKAFILGVTKLLSKIKPTQNPTQKPIILLGPARGGKGVLAQSISKIFDNPVIFHKSFSFENSFPFQNSLSLDNDLIVFDDVPKKNLSSILKNISGENILVTQQYNRSFQMKIPKIIITIDFKIKVTKEMMETIDFIYCYMDRHFFIQEKLASESDFLKCDYIIS
jgi:hypothetical protein